MSGTAIASSVRILWRMLEHEGVDPRPLFDEVGLDPDKLNDPRARYPADRMRMAWTRATELLGDPGFALGIAKVWRPTDFHALGYAFMASSTLRVALSRLVHYNAVVDNVVNFAVTESGDRSVLSYVAERGEVPEPPALEFGRWSVVLDMCRRAYGTDLDPVEVAFSHPEPTASMGEFFGYFRCPMQFDASVPGITFTTDVLDKPLPAANRELARAHDRVLSEFVGKLKRDDIVSRVKSAISENLPTGELTDEVVANALHMSARTLQRKLAAEDTSFRNLVEAVRRELAESYLADGNLSLIEVSYMLGFSERSSFSRAFKRWTGFTPQEFRGAAE